MKAPRLHLEMNYCHRCGAELTVQNLSHIFRCENGHTIYANASPAVAVLLFDRAGKVLIMARAQEPGVGRLTVPGGFCNGAESIEDGLVREVFEETKIPRDAYGELRFMCSGLDSYSEDGETTPVSAVMFQAKLRTDAIPELDAENVWAEYMSLDAVDLEQVWSPTVRQALAMAQAAVAAKKA
jgi:ADP-ribose pyrophosphatase YjhB (NUDIX family)